MTSVTQLLDLPQSSPKPLTSEDDHYLGHLDHDWEIPKQIPCGR